MIKYKNRNEYDDIRAAIMRRKTKLYRVTVCSFFSVFQHCMTLTILWSLCCLVLPGQCTTFLATFIRSWRRHTTECCSRYRTTITTYTRPTTALHNWAVAGGILSARSGHQPWPAPSGSASLTLHSTRWTRLAWWSSYSDQRLTTAAHSRHSHYNDALVVAHR